jgi:phosphatidylglycerol:prolipoprotein diacylglycerol transferase
MFYYPPELWSLDFFIEKLLQGNFQTFHACIVLPIIIFGILIVSFRFRFLQVWDILFLHLPLAHAIARIGCLIAGCCWGPRFWFSLFGAAHTFSQPVPLYEAAMNSSLYVILRRVFDKIHFSEANGSYSGAVAGLYFVGYGIIRLLLEPMRAEKVVVLGLTQAQLAMPLFVLFGAGVLLYVYYQHHAARRDR